MEPDPLAILEALLFVSDGPLELDRVQEVLGLPQKTDAQPLMAELIRRYEEDGRGLQIISVAGGYRLVTRPELAPWLLRLQRIRSRSRLSGAALETLAIVAYQQPVSRADIEALRGVNAEAVLSSLLERRLIKVLGRKNAPGRPLLYGTTKEFLSHFGLDSVKDLPKIEEARVLEERGLGRTAAGESENTPVHGEAPSEGLIGGRGRLEEGSGTPDP